MKTLAEWETVRDEARAGMHLPGQPGNQIRVVVGLATCGLAAGAQDVMDALTDEVRRRQLKDIHIVKTGCIGVCRLEPIVEVFLPEQGRVTYVNMTPEKARQIVAEHIAGGQPHIEYTIGAHQ